MNDDFAAGTIHPCVTYPLSDVVLELPDISDVDLDGIGGGE